MYPRAFASFHLNRIQHRNGRIRGNRLKGENEALIKRLKELEEGGYRAGEGVGDDLVPRESWEVVNEEKTELEEVVKQK
jgi:mitotic spindle assembly checkpoint protein MAD1